MQLKHKKFVFALYKHIRIIQMDDELIIIYLRKTNKKK